MKTNLPPYPYADPDVITANQARATGALSMLLSYRLPFASWGIGATYQDAVTPPHLTGQISRNDDDQNVAAIAEWCAAFSSDVECNTYEEGGGSLRIYIDIGGVKVDVWTALKGDPTPHAERLNSQEGNTR